MGEISDSASEIDFTEGKNCIYAGITASEVMPQIELQVEPQAKTALIKNFYKDVNQVI